MVKIDINFIIIYIYHNKNQTHKMQESKDNILKVQAWDMKTKTFKMVQIHTGDSYPSDNFQNDGKYMYNDQLSNSTVVQVEGKYHYQDCVS